ncbi:MAG: invasion associated locus B family protein [Pseudolabrys sp.]
MRTYHWVAIVAAGVLVTASAAAVFGSQKSTDSDRDVRLMAAKNNSSLIRESQVRQPAAASSSPQRVETIKYDSWVVVCAEAGGSSKKTCSAKLQAVNQEQGQVLVDWEIGMNREGHYVTAFRVPPVFGFKKDNKVIAGPLLIQNGVELKFGNGPARRINYVWCGPKQCFAEALIDEAFIKEALANTKATITVHTAGGGAIPIEIPIKGIDKAISSTRK